MSKTGKHKLISRSCWYVMLVVFMGVCVLPTSAYILLYRNRIQPPEWPIYSVDDVQKVCEWFDIVSNDVFCASPNNNDPYAFDAMLRSRFPIGVATYDEVMKPVHILLEKPSNAELSQMEDFPIGNCPPSNQRGETYQCLVFLASDYSIGPIVFHFDTSSNTLVTEGISRPSSS